MKRKNLERKYVRALKDAPEDYCPIKIYQNVYNETKNVSYFPSECETCSGYQSECLLDKKKIGLEKVISNLKEGQIDKIIIDKKNGKAYWKKKYLFGDK